MPPETLDLAVRVYPDFLEKGREEPPFSPRPEQMLVLDTETRTDALQGLLFGSYQLYQGRELIREELFCGDDISPQQLAVLRRYAERENIGLLSRDEFVKKFYTIAYKTRSLIVAFNFPFDISRIAYDFAPARKFLKGGFSFGMNFYVDTEGNLLSNKYRPRIAIKHINSKSALKQFTSRRDPDPVDLIPEGSETGEPEKYSFRGHFLDLRTLAFALTDRGHTLESACKAFGVANGKKKVSRHGEVTDEYITYNRQDVKATAELAFKLFEEYDKHPIKLQDTKALSPASVGKSYLWVMGIRPILERQPDFPKHLLGFAQSAFIGGRTSAHIRKCVVPVVHTDFLSMYATVNSNMDLWSLVTANKFKYIEHCREYARKLFAGFTVESLFDPATWKTLKGFAK